MPPDTVEELIANINFYVLNPIISILFGLAFIIFIWGVAQYLIQANSDEARSRGTKHILWGLVGMLIMFTAFLILRVIASSIGAEVDGEPLLNFIPKP